MKALVLEAYGRFAYREVPTPRPAAGEVLIAVRACAVCGSDVHGMDGSSGRRRPPIIMGHEAAGVIEALGPGVSGWRVGDRVTFDSTIYCGRCASCEMGLVNLCPERRVLGVSCEDYRLDGAMAEYVSVPERILYRLPEGVSFTQAAMVEPLAIAYHAATRARVTDGCCALVVGVGTIGMLTLQVLRALGAGGLIAVDLDDGKLAAALRAGASAAVSARESQMLEMILAATPGGLGADVAVDATGVEATLRLCLDALRLGGSAVLVGNLARRVSFPLQQVVTRQLSLFGSCASAGEYPQCLDMISSGQVDVEALISKSVPLSQGGEWIQRVYRGEADLHKIVLLP